MIILTYKVNKLLLINKIEASIRRPHVMGAGLPTCNPSGGGNGLVNLLVGPAKLGFVSELVESFKRRRSSSKLGHREVGQINPSNSVSESCTGMGVVAPFLAGAGMVPLSHLKMTESVSRNRYL
jgi:hypothetical protein